jgi:hypothetical protein
VEKVEFGRRRRVAKDPFEQCLAVLADVTALGQRVHGLGRDFHASFSSRALGVCAP